MIKIALPSHQEYRLVETGSCTFYVGEDASEYTSVIPLMVNNFNHMPFQALIGLEVVAIDRKQIIASLEKTEKLFGHFRLLHGGVVAACIDAIGAYKAVHEIYLRADNTNLVEIMRRTMGIRTKEIHVEYLNEPVGDWYQIAGVTLSYSRTMVNEVTMTDNTGKLVAKGTASYMELSELRKR